MSIPLISPVVAKRIRGICCASRIAPTARSSTARLPISVIVPPLRSKRCGWRYDTSRSWKTLGQSSFLTIADNGKDTNGQEQKYRTRTELDIEGNQRAVIDAKDRV